MVSHIFTSRSTQGKDLKLRYNVSCQNQYIMCHVKIKGGFVEVWHQMKHMNDLIYNSSHRRL